MSSFMSWLRVSLSGLTMVTLSAVFLVLMIPLLPWRLARIYSCNIYGTIAGKVMAWACAAEITFHHRERVNEQKPAIYISNHTSTLDMWMGMWICPMGGCGLAKREIRFVPGVGQLYLLSGHPMIDRSNRERAISTMNDVAKFITANGLSLWIWPEGTRSRDGQLQVFKKGFVHAALATNLPIVPIVVHNAAKVWPRGKVKFNPGLVDVDVLPSVSTEDWSVETLDQHVADIRQIFESKLAEGPPSVA